MNRLKALRITGFKKFQSLTFEFNEHMNILVGENEAGKSTILDAIKIVLNQQYRNADKAILKDLFNTEMVKAFQASPSINLLPYIVIEVEFELDPKSKNAIYFFGEVYGQRKSQECRFGIRFECKFDDDMSSELATSIQLGKIPYEYYLLSWTTFGNKPYLVQKRPLQFISIDVTSGTSATSFNYYNRALFSNKYDADIYKELDSRFPGKYHVLHVGRKVEQKNLDTVIKSMKYLDKNIVTVFVGLGDSTGYKELAIKEGVSDRCYFVERVSNEQIPFWYSWCDCMCTPSRWEGFGYVFIEAASCESAIVTSNIGPMNEYLSNWENALLIDDYENPEEIAKAIDFCVKKSEKVLKMRKNAREVGLAFEKERIDKMEIAIYDKMTTILPNNKINHAIKRDIIISSFIEEGKKIVRRLRFKKE